MALTKVKMEDLAGARPGRLVGYDYPRGYKMESPVRLMLELQELKKHPETGDWVWIGKVVKCTKRAASVYMGQRRWIFPQDEIMVVE